MSNKHYINEIGTSILINCGENISSATVYKLMVRKPKGNTVEWIPSIYENNYLLYNTITNDLNQAGEYVIQPYLEFPDWKGRGESITFYVYGYFDADGF